MRDAIVRTALECRDTPFVHQGRVVGQGIDCAGVLVHIFKTLGLPYVDERGYPRRPYNGLIKGILDAQPSLAPIDKNTFQHGDLLLMKIRHEPMHVAIYTGQSIIHSYSGIGRVVEHRLDAAWRKRITHAYQIVRPE